MKFPMLVKKKMVENIINLMLTFLLPKSEVVYNQQFKIQY